MGGAMKRQRLNKERTKEKEKKKKKFKEKETQPRLEMNHVTRASRSSRLLFSPFAEKQAARLRRVTLAQIDQKLSHLSDHVRMELFVA